MNKLMLQALESIIELHKIYETSSGQKFCVVCTRTEDEWEYPCETVAIAKEALK